MAERLILVCKKYAYANTEVSAFPYLTELYRFAQDNADLCLVLLGPNGDRAYTERICSILRATSSGISCPVFTPAAPIGWITSVPLSSPAT